MIRFYVDIRQLHNFLDLKEPVQFYPNAIGDGYVEMWYKEKDVDIKIYQTYITIEIKKRRSLWQRLRRKNN
jgi:hypothetical protein